MYIYKSKKNYPMIKPSFVTHLHYSLINKSGRKPDNHNQSLFNNLLIEC